MNEASTDNSGRLVTKNRVPPIWCPGCGDFGVLQALVRALQELGRKPKDTVLVSGIGCSGRLPYFIDAYGFHTLHGRALPVATGLKLSNPKLTVIVVGGDGDGFGIGGGHVPHAARRNIDLTYLVLDNGVYALTKGHSSPTTDVGQKTPSARQGEDTPPLDILGMLLAYRSSFVACGYSGDRPRLTELLVEAIRHSGFSAVQVMSPCPTYNQDMNYDSLRSELFRVPEEHTCNDHIAALTLHYAHAGMLDGVVFQDTGKQPAGGTEVAENGKERFARLVEKYV